MMKNIVEAQSPQELSIYTSCRHEWKLLYLFYEVHKLLPYKIIVAYLHYFGLLNASYNLLMV